MSFIDRDGKPVDVSFEKDEQDLVWKYIPSDATVLELGARYGTVSCVLSSILDDGTKHVAVEPDATVIGALLYNKQKNNGMFKVFEGVVSREGYDIHFIDPKFDHHEYGTYTKRSETPTITNVSLEDLEMRYGLTFDCVVADCEGFFYDFVKENPSAIQNMRVLIYEQDGTPWAEYIDKYKEVDTILESYGFKLVHTIPHPMYENNPRFHNVWVKESTK